MPLISVKWVFVFKKVEYARLLMSAPQVVKESFATWFASTMCLCLICRALPCCRRVHCPRCLDVYTVTEATPGQIILFRKSVFQNSKYNSSRSRFFYTRKPTRLN